MDHSKDLPPVQPCRDQVCRRAQEAKHRYKTQQIMKVFNVRKLSFFLSDHNACGHLFMVELFSHADCWYYLSCHRLDCDLGHWVSPGTITEGIHEFHLVLPPLDKDWGTQGITGSVHRLQWEPNRVFQTLILLPRS